MRAEFSRKTKRAAWTRCRGLCEGCNITLLPLTVGFHYDHIDPTWMSGRDDLDNCQVLCLACHAQKTAKDQGDIAKSKRIRDKTIKAKTARRPMPFGKRSRWKKKMDGTVVER